MTGFLAESEHLGIEHTEFIMIFMRLIFSFPLFLAIAALCPVAAFGENQGSKGTRVRLSPLRCLEARAAQPQSPRDKTRDKIELTIANVSRKALENNLSLRIEGYSPRISATRVKGAEAYFDPALSFGGTLTRGHAETEFFETESQGTNLNAAIGKRFSSGLRTLVGISASKTDPIGGSREHAASANLTLTLPLLKNRGRDVNTRDIVLSRNNHDIAELNFMQRAIDTVSQAQTLYWNLYKAQQELAVQKKSLELAKKFSEFSKARARIGHIAPADILQAEAEVASREEWVIIAENDVRNRRRSLLCFTLGTYETSMEVKLLQQPDYENIVFDENRLIRSALEKRPDYRIANLDIGNAEINLVYAKNQTLPLIDLRATLRVNALEESWGKAYQRAGKDYSGSVDISVEFPWGMRKDNAEHQAALYEKRRSLIRLLRTEQEIISEVRTALGNLGEADKRYHTTTLSKKLAEKKLSAEERKFRLGLSTSYNVLLYQRDLTDAAVRTINAVIDYQLALIHLDKVTGVMP